MTRTRPTASLAIAASLLAASAVACARRPDEKASTRASSVSVTPAAATDTSAAALTPLDLPDLSAVATPVQTQIRDAYQAVQQMPSTATGVDAAERYGRLGHLLTAAAFYDEGTQCYQHAEAAQPAEARWPYLRAHALLRKGDRVAASRALERTLQLQPSYVPALIWLGDTWLDLGRPSDARSMYARALTLQPESAAALFGAGRAALAAGDYGDAVRQLEHALALDPRASVIHYPLAMAYRGAGNRARAEQLLRQRGNTAPELPDPLLQQADVTLNSAVSFEALGMQALRQQDWPSAIQAFSRGLEVSPGDASLRYWLGSARAASGDAAGAERDFQSAVRLKPDFANAHFSLGAMLDRRGQKADALREYRAAVAAAPTMPAARVRLGDTLRAQGDFPAAAAQYEEAVKLDPTAIEAWVGGAQALIASGQRDAAKAWIARARLVHPNRHELEDLDARLR